MTMKEADNKIIPLKEELFHIPSGPGDQTYLIGSRCKECGKYFFPRRYTCLNCFKEAQEEVALSGKGRVWDYTVSYMAPPGCLIQPPYIIAHVELTEGARVKTLVDNCAPDKVNINMEVEFALKKVSQDEQGNDVLAFVFQPSSG